MAINRIFTLPRLALLGCVCLASLSTGCQSRVGGQTLPSAFYLQDDVQYFPAGPEFKLTKQVEALEQYKLRTQGVAPAPAEVP
ncbi:MAG TPA: hypothetical protein VHB77_01910 [Planctomycetaceae bacterium]|nr:hypothetical protein [Planctomycetaceae bacterium]